MAWYGMEYTPHSHDAGSAQEILSQLSPNRSPDLRRGKRASLCESFIWFPPLGSFLRSAVEFCLA